MVAEVSAFTNGPWHVTDIDGSRIPIIASFVSDDKHPVAALCNYHSAQREANARLIAAAPDLYEALEAFCDAYVGESGLDRAMQDGIDAHLISARAALQKARGSDD